jgi:hypothetical protein
LLKVSLKIAAALSHLGNQRRLPRTRRLLRGNWPMNESRRSDGSRHDLTGVIAIGFDSFREVVDGAAVKAESYSALLSVTPNPRRPTAT